MMSLLLTMEGHTSPQAPDVDDARKMSPVVQDPSTSSGVMCAETIGGNVEVLGRGITSILENLISGFADRAEGVGQSQVQLSNSIDRLTRELDQLLEDAPMPFIMQHASKISGLCKRVSSLNTILKSMQRRIDNIDHLLSLQFSEDCSRLFLMDW
ncbi:uncharacterized protein LOC116267670 isoform X2 [Nymphaea colorata]|uniref:uncharacterized protein LOC116267670 isoform X2 n=1 Tax=Nymphaea colorata TaxID=210225 RepID=UPI00214DFD48|nr:uncharacterized protein LOC116267670 isoform X2 [Nymphaea colorata]